MSKFIDLSGKRFGHLTVISRYGSTPNKMATWLCQCDCGNTKIVQTCHLNAGVTISCGCYQKKRASVANSTHHASKTRLYNEWQHMKKRCYCKSYSSYHLYGGRGITVCSEWKNSFESFQKWAVANGYSDQLTLDRIDTNKGYSPKNCRWTTMLVQSNNRNMVKIVQYHGDSGSYEVMCRKLNVNTGTIRSRMKKHNISFEEAVDNFPTTAPYVNYTQRAKEKRMNSIS